MDGAVVEEELDPWGPESYLDAIRRGEVRSDVPFAELAERTHLGLDHHDEVWDGTLHMNPQPNFDHQDLVLRLAALLLPLADGAGLRLLHEFGLIPPTEPGWGDYRVPDLMLFASHHATKRGTSGANLVVEVRSPNDESFRKLPFFEELGVGEVLIIDRDTKAIRRWRLVAGTLVEQEPDSSGTHHLSSLPVAMRTEAERLVVTVNGTTTTI